MAERSDLWLDLAADIPITPTPWAMVGDFNATLQSHEKKGPGNFSMGSAAESFCNEQWLTIFQDSSQVVLPRIASDHGSILMTAIASQCPLNCPLRFHQFWMDHEEFNNVVASSWFEWIAGPPIVVLTSKLKRLKGVLKTWARSAFPHIERELEDAKTALNQIHDQIAREGMNDYLFASEADVKTGLVKALENHEKIWAKKVRIRWLKVGDRNSKYFHLSVKMRRNKNTIRVLKRPDGTMVEGQNQIGEYIVDFFERFHKEAPIETHADLLDNIPKVLNQMDCYRLDSLPGNEEIRRAVWELDPDSSPGPDGFSGAFFCKCWSLVEVEVCNAVRQFFSTGYMPHGVNNNFLVLIPKVEGANTLDRFRPLCMGNFFCKIISKVMAMRLEPLLLRLISEEQGAFQKGKLIHDNISVASELANLMFSATKVGSIGCINF
ncbi:uncharacterized protein LOC122060674 [Macadamia integrifolia]|uniref:uncharacterized protein LOC122060674 n=1 Tax=Macadamia integrifolia TaxID=60698 RepID=UPI001C52B445|nr:uncharacterized protein LOC122060674 [Macadamia integrifolia]